MNTQSLYFYETYLFLVHLDKAGIDFHPRWHRCDAPQLIRVLAKVSRLHLANVVDAADEHKMILEIIDDLLVHKLGRIKGTLHCKPKEMFDLQGMGLSTFPTCKLCTAPDEWHKLKVIQCPDTLTASGFHVIDALQLPHKVQITIEQTQCSANNILFQ